MKKQSLILICIFLILLPRSAKTEDQIYTDHDLKSRDYEHLTPENRKKKSQPTIIEYRDLMTQNIEKQRQIQQRNDEIKRNFEKQQLEFQQKQIIARRQFEEATEKAKTSAAAFFFLFIIMPTIAWLIALVSVLNNDFTGSNKMIWFLTVTFIPIIGPILYFFMQDKYKIIRYES